MTLPEDNPPDLSKLQSKMNAAVKAHWKAFLFEGIVLALLGLAAMIVPPLASLAAGSCPGGRASAPWPRPPASR